MESIRVMDANGSVELDNDFQVSEKLGDELPEDLDSYLEDINDRLTISRMVSDSVTMGMVNAVEQEAVEKIARKELEVAKLRDMLHLYHVGADEKESFGAPWMHHESKCTSHCRMCYNFSDTFVEHDSMRESLGSLRSTAKEQFKKLKKEIESIKGCSSITRISSGSELLGLDGILQEKVPESWIDVDRTLESLKATVDTVYKQAEDMFQLPNASLCAWQQEQVLQAEIEVMVNETCIRGLQEEFEERLLDHSAQFYGHKSVNWLEKIKEISSLRQELNTISKSLSLPEFGQLTSLGSLEIGEEWSNDQGTNHFHRKVLSNHVSSSTLIWEGNGKHEEPSSNIPANSDHAQLKRMSKEELITEMTKMKRNHESKEQEMTEENFRLKWELLRLVQETTAALVKEKEQSKLTSQELEYLKDQTNQYQILFLESSKVSNVMKGNLAMAFEQIELYKMETCELNQMLELAMKRFREVDEERRMLLAVIQEKQQEKQNALSLAEAKEREHVKQMESIIIFVQGLLKAVADFENRVTEDISTIILRLENLSSESRLLMHKANMPQRTELLYKKRFKRRCSDLEKTPKAQTSTVPTDKDSPTAEAKTLVSKRSKKSTKASKEDVRPEQNLFLSLSKTLSATSSAGLELRDESIDQPIKVEDLENDEGVGDSEVEVTDAQADKNTILKDASVSEGSKSPSSSSSSDEISDHVERGVPLVDEIMKEAEKEVALEITIEKPSPASSTMSTHTKTSMSTKHRLEALKARFIGSSAPKLISPPTEIEEASNLLSSLSRIDLDAAMVPEMKEKIFKAIETLETDPNLQIGTSSNLASIKKKFEKIQARLKTVHEVETQMTNATNQKEKVQVNISTLSTEVVEFEKKMKIVQSQRNLKKKEVHDLEKKLKKTKTKVAELNKKVDCLEQDEMDKMSTLEKLKSELKAIEEGGEALLVKIEAAYKDYDEASNLFNSIRFP